MLHIHFSSRLRCSTVWTDRVEIANEISVRCTANRTDGQSGQIKRSAYLADRRKADQSDTGISGFHYIETLAFLALFTCWFEQLRTVFGQFGFQETQMVFGGWMNGEKVSGP